MMEIIYTDAKVVMVNIHGKTEVCIKEIGNKIIFLVKVFIKWQMEINMKVIG
jgi:hypothetical protein